MKMEAYRYSPPEGWSTKSFQDLDSAQTLVLAFCAPEYYEDRTPLDALHAAYPSSKIIGCSSAGEILDSSVNDQSIVAGVAKFEHTELRLASARIADGNDSFAAGQEIAKQLARDDLQGVFILSPGTDVNGSELVKGIYSIFSTPIPVTGGLAGDGDRFERTWTVFEGEVHEGRAVAIGFYGDRVRIGYGSGGGWDIFGPMRRVTESSGNILFSLDDKPALTLYKRYLGERAAGLPATALLFPLAIRSDTANRREVVRTVLAIDEEHQSMTFAGDIPSGSLAQLMKANVDRLIDGALLAAQNAAHVQAQSAPAMSVAVSCVGRRLVMSGRTDEELEITLDTMPDDTRQIGFYSYGEIAPVDNSPSDLHNQTMTVTVLSES